MFFTFYEAFEQENRNRHFVRISIPKSGDLLLFQLTLADSHQHADKMRDPFREASPYLQNEDY